MTTVTQVVGFRVGPPLHLVGLPERGGNVFVSRLVAVRENVNALDRRYAFASLGCIETGRALIPAERSGSADSVGARVRYSEKRPAFRMHAQVVETRTVAPPTHVGSLSGDDRYRSPRVPVGRNVTTGPV